MFARHFGGGVIGGVTSLETCVQVARSTGIPCTDTIPKHLTAGLSTFVHEIYQKNKGFPATGDDDG